MLKNFTSYPIDEFAPKLDAWFSRVAALLQRTDQIETTTNEISPIPCEQQQLLMETSEELQIALEELRIAQEELYQQHEELLQKNQELMAARDAVDAERRRYQELFELAPNGYFVTDVSGKIKDVNRAAAELLNVEPRFLGGKPLSLFIEGEERQNFYSLLNQLSQVERVQEWEVRLQPRNAKPFDAVLSVTPVRDKENKLIALRWLLRDISDRKRMEEQRRLLVREQTAREIAQSQAQRSAFLAEASRLLVGSLDYRTTLANVAQLAIATFADWCFIDLVENNLTHVGEPIVAASDSQKEALLLELRRRYPLAIDADYGVARVVHRGEPELVPEIPDYFLLSIARDAEHLELLRQFKAKSYLVVPLTIGERTLGTITFLSAQPERRYRQADLAMAVELAQRCAIAIDNARLYQEAQEANRIKDEFLAIVSHELRTPLNSMLGWVTMLRHRKLNEATVAKALETIERNAQSQAKLIEDILDISRIIRGKIRLNTHPVHLAPLIDAVIENVRPTAELKAIQIKAILNPKVGEVMGDAERLQQIIWNLLTNAIKFTPQGGHIEIRLEQVNTTAQLSVKDTGKGIRADFLPYVFERFRQADAATTRSHGGLGLGLAIVRHLVDMHNGVVHASSEGEGRGATFTVRIPTLNSPQQQLPEKHRVVLDEFPSLDGLRVVVVDDCTDTLELLAFMLEQCKAKVMKATSADEAFRAIAKWKPDVLISDIGMPGEDGYSLITRVRNLEVEPVRQIPAIALTAFAREEERTLALNAGFQMHIPKPVEPAQFLAVVANLAGRNH